MKCVIVIKKELKYMNEIKKNSESLSINKNNTN